MGIGRKKHDLLERVRCKHIIIIIFLLIVPFIQILQKYSSVADPIKTFSSLIKNSLFFTVKVGNFIINFFSLPMYQTRKNWKMKIKVFCIGSATGQGKT